MLAFAFVKTAMVVTIVQLVPMVMPILMKLVVVFNASREQEDSVSRQAVDVFPTAHRVFLLERVTILPVQFDANVQITMVVLIAVNVPKDTQTFLRGVSRLQRALLAYMELAIPIPSVASAKIILLELLVMIVLLDGLETVAPRKYQTSLLETFLHHLPSLLLRSFALSWPLQFWVEQLVFSCTRNSSSLKDTVNWSCLKWRNEEDPFESFSEYT